MVLRAAFRTAVSQFAAGHRHEWAFGALYDLQIPDHKLRIKGDRAKALKSIVRIVHEFDANFSNFHLSRCASLGPALDCTDMTDAHGSESHGNGTRLSTVGTEAKVGRSTAAHHVRQNR